jgi:iron complex transport system substrate-binding protein
MSPQRLWYHSFRVFGIWQVLFVVLASFVSSLPVYALDTCGRVVSLAPSITETLYTLQLGASVVGVTSYDRYPAEVVTKTKIGGFLDPSLEGITALRPSIVIGLVEQRDVLKHLEELGIKTYAVDHRYLTTILQSFTDIASVCEVIDAGKTMRSEIEQMLADTRRITESLKRKKVVVVVARDYYAPDLREVYVSGKDGIYDSLLPYAGGENAVTDTYGSARAVSLEGLYALHPDSIIEVLPPGTRQAVGDAALRAPWERSGLLQAVREGNLHLIDDDWATIPGPRLTMLLQKLQSLLHSETTP